MKFKNIKNEEDKSKDNNTNDLNRVSIKLKDISKNIDKYKSKEYINYILDSHLNNINSIINAKKQK